VVKWVLLSGWLLVAKWGLLWGQLWVEMWVDQWEPELEKT
jgi:hypothetical protein